MNNLKVVPITQNERQKAESERDKWAAKTGEDINTIIKSLIKTSENPLTLAFVFQDLSMVLAEMTGIAEQNQSSKRRK